jgi:DNA/RNA-binding domain of Phe-tRNA-synthetase-like protein
VTIASGERRVENAPVGEVIWCDDAGVTCRAWNWRQGPRTALTDDTTNTLFIFDALEACKDANLNAAGNELVNALSQSSPSLQVARRIISAPSYE